jgi:lactoylglutathione lyase
MAHAMIRAVNLEKSIKFYTGPLGMKLLRREDFTEGRFTVAFVGYGPEASNTVIELTHN